MFDTYYRLDLVINKGVTRGLETSIDYWPESSFQKNDIDIMVQALRLQAGYSFSFMLPSLGAVDLTPALGLWS